MSATLQHKIVRVIVVSPGDVKSERDTLPNVLDELNRGLAGYLELRLELWRWETDSYPGFHPEGPQGLIDEIMEIEDSDIVIGIFWKRFGTPVYDADSGTEHELRKAWTAWNRNRRPQIMMYFNEKPYSPTTATELDQWKAVIEFKKQLPKEVMRWAYKGKANFETLVRRHLTQFLRQEYGRKSSLSDESNDFMRESLSPVSQASHLPVSHSAQRINTLVIQIQLPGIGKAHKSLLLAEDYLYVSDWDNQDVVFIDPRRRTVLGSIALDSFEAAYPTPSREKNNTALERAIRRYPPGNSVVANGKLFVGQVFSEFVLVIDLAAQVIVKRVAVGGEGSLAASPDGRKVYFASNQETQFYIIDTDTYEFEVISYPDAGRGCLSVLAHPTKEVLYLGIQRGGSIKGKMVGGGNSFIAVYNLVSRSYVAHIYSAEIFDGDISDDSMPFSMAFLPEENLLYVGMLQSRRGIYLIDTEKNEIVDHIPFEPNSENSHFKWVDPISVTPYKEYLLSLNRNNYELAVLDRRSCKQVAVVALGGSGNGPQSVVVVDDEAIIAHAEYDGLLIVDLLQLLSKSKGA